MNLEYLKLDIPFCGPLIKNSKRKTFCITQTNDGADVFFQKFVKFFHEIPCILLFIINCVYTVERYIWSFDWFTSHKIIFNCCKIFKVCLTNLGHYALKG